MIEKAAHVLAKKLFTGKHVTKEEREVYQYGLRQLFDFVINVLTVIVIGGLFGMVWQGILLSMAYIPLRRMAGGYHASNPQICYLMSTVLLAVSLILIRDIDISLEILIGLIVMSLMLFILKAPVESRNKPLSDKEKATYRKWTFFIAVFEYAAAMILFLIEWRAACNCIAVAFCTAAMLLLFSDKIYEKA